MPAFELDFQVATYQASMWTPDVSVSGAKLLRSLPEEWFELFDGEPTVLPIPNDAPREVPRLLLASADEAWRCEVSSERVNVFWRRTSRDATEPTADEFFNRASGFLEAYKGIDDPRAGRLAGLVHRIVEHGSPAEFLVDRFCKPEVSDGLLRDLDSFELHAHKRFNLSDSFRVNSWVRSKTGFANEDGKSYPIVLLEQDLNTLNEELAERSFNVEELRRYFSLLPNEFSSILRLYFHKEPSE